MFERVHPAAPSGNSRHWSERVRASFCEPFQTNNTLLSCVAWQDIAFLSLFSAIVLMLLLQAVPEAPLPGYCHVLMATWFLIEHRQNACLYCACLVICQGQCHFPPFINKHNYTSSWYIVYFLIALLHSYSTYIAKSFLAGVFVNV